MTATGPKLDKLLPATSAPPSLGGIPTRTLPAPDRPARTATLNGLSGGPVSVRAGNSSLSRT
jgi:hypothetical protein